MWSVLMISHLYGNQGQCNSDAAAAPARHGILFQVKHFFYDYKLICHVGPHMTSFEITNDFNCHCKTILTFIKRSSIPN